MAAKVFLIANVPITLRSVWIGAACSVCILGFYFLAQSYQEKDDRTRGDDTLVARYGTAIVVQYGQWCLRWGIIALLLASALGFLPRVLLVLSYPSWKLDMKLSRWRSDVTQFDTQVINGVIRSCFYMCLSGLTLVLISDIYFAVSEGVYCGFSTARGHASIL